MPAFLDRLDKYSVLTDAEKKKFRMLMTDFLPSGVDYKFKCEPLTFDLPESFIELWQKYPENPNPEANPIDSFNQWRSKVADELSLEKIGYMPPIERLSSYGSIDGKKFRTILMDLQALSSKEFEGITFQLPKQFIDAWKNHPENISPNADPIETLTEYCKKVNDEIRNPDKYINPENKPILTELSQQERESLKVAPPTIEYPNHSFINTASFDYSLIKARQDEFSQQSETPTLNDYALVRATDNFPINGYHVPINQDTRISKSKSFLGPDIASFEYSEMKNFAVNGLTEFPGWDDKTFNIIEPLEDHINNPNLIALHPGDTIFDVSNEPLRVSPNAIFLIPEEQYTALMQQPEMKQQLANKNVVVFRGNTKEAIDMQLYKMGITPYSCRGDFDIDTLKRTDIDKKIIEGLESISTDIGRPGLEQVMYKEMGGIVQSDYIDTNLTHKAELDAKCKRDFFEFFFKQNPNLSKQRDKLIALSEKSFREFEMDFGNGFKRFENDIYSEIKGETEEEKVIIDEIYTILGEDGVNSTINAYNEMVTLAFQQRHKKYVESLPEIETETTLDNSQPTQSFEKNIGIANLDDIEPINAHVQGKSNFYKNIGTQIPLNSIVEYSKEIASLFDKVEDVQSQNNSTSKVHGVQHVKNVLLLSNYLGLINGLSHNDLSILREAAIYHDISHEQAADPTHAKKGASWYLENVESSLNKEEVAYLIEAHELSGKTQLGDLAKGAFPNISEQRKAELIRCAEILQDADRLDILRYDIENPKAQRFQPGRLNNSQSSELISAVIELNTKQAINKQYLQIKDGKVCLNERLRPEQEQKREKKFEESTLDSELQELSSETTMSGFNEMSQNVKYVQKLNEQEQVLSEAMGTKESEGWDVNDD